MKTEETSIISCAPPQMTPDVTISESIVSWQLKQCVTIQIGNSHGGDGCDRQTTGAALPTLGFQSTPIDI